MACTWLTLAAGDQEVAMMEVKQVYKSSPTCATVT
eukprot:CAMPEP_0182849850 /NCGR_PEP_ID=MMETSP0006_2-20121128/29777_1 /TAXON_ID=97485 /ORGANISM="Prymnesium parvum, Strain Texoma1" /LENGTH=34 /DNA_ID= /DNA_START= /DNA_END= /DNA_ORIENTATION=